MSEMCHERKSYPKASVLIEVRHKLVRQYRPIAINDAKVGRIVLTVVDPSLGSQQCVCGSLCAKGLSSLDYLAGRIHFDNTGRSATTVSSPWPTLYAMHTRDFGREKHRNSA